MKLRPLSDHIVVESVAEDKKKSHIILPDTVDKEKSERGKVVAVGAGKLDNDGKRIPLQVKKGDVVLFTKYSPNEVKVEGKDYLIIKEEDILAILE